MLALLNWRILAAVGLAVALAATHWKAYSMGGAEYRAKMANLQTEMLSKAATASEENRKIEQTMAVKIRKAQDDYTKLQKTNADNAASLDRVRGDFQTALNSRCTENPTAPGCADGTGRLERELFSHCASALQKLGIEADRLEAKTVGLQEYVRAITLAR